MNYTDAINWLKRAQDLTHDDGISGFYDARYGLWMPSYPEVSGYIIPTFIDAGEEDRALRISRWLRKKQLQCGSMPTGLFGGAQPIIFDTGMALIGWLRAQQVEYDPRTQESIDKAVEFMESVWRKDHTQFLPTHNIRAVWPLKDYGSKLVPEMIEFFEEQINDNGWPRNCEDQFPEAPLSHFIIYVARGFYECGDEGTAHRIMENLPSVPNARYDDQWTPITDDICIPGVAQASILFRKLGLRSESQRGLNYLETLSAPWASDPIDADYLPHCQLSWSAKFIADAFKENETLP